MSEPLDSTAQQNKFQQSTYTALKKELEDTIKKIANYEKRELPKDETQREERISKYAKELTGTYNNFISYTGLFHGAFDLQLQFNVNAKVEILKLKVKKSLNILKLDIVLPENLNKIDSVRPLESHLELNNTTPETASTSALTLARSGSENSINSQGNTDPSKTIS